MAIALLVIGSWAASAVAAENSPSHSAPQADLATFERVIKPFLAKHCVECHGPKMPEASLSFDKLNADLLTGHDAERWNEVLTRLNLGEMPPEDKPRPQPAEIAAAVHWITGELRKAEQVARARGGGILLRRLNNTEYANTLRDLLGSDFGAAEHFSDDPATHGFDNVASGLNFSPLHVENYLAAAERVLDLALVSGEAPPKVHYRVDYLGPRDKPVVPDPRGNGKGQLEGKEVAIKPGRFRGKDADFNFSGKTNYKELETVGAPPVLHHDVIDLITTPPTAYRRAADLFFGGETGFKDEAIGRGTVKLRQFNYDAGTYRFRIKASGFMPNDWQGALPVLMVKLEPEKTIVKQIELSADPQTVEFTVYRESIATYRARYNQRSFGVTLQFPSYVLVPGPSGKPEKVPVGVNVESIEIEGPFLESWPPQSHRRILFDSPLANTDETAYAREVLTRFMSKAYRRPVAEADVTAMLALYAKRRAAGGDFLSAIKVPLTAILASPKFLCVVEPRGEDSPPRKLDDYELASRLSYFLWSSPPDEELLKLAAAGKLNDVAMLRTQTRRLLADPRSRAFVHNFADQWLKLRKLNGFMPDGTLYPNFTPALRSAMLGETRVFFGEVLHNNLSVLEFLDSDWAMLNQTLAAFYGIPDVRGGQFRRVPLLPEHHRGGVLTHASVLTVTSNGIRTLPVQRGVFVLEQLLADPPPPPPPNAGQLEDTAPEAENLSVKDRLAQHRRNATCAACHAKIDPYGFAMESYDAIGQFRTHERLLTETTKKDKNGQTITVPRATPGRAVETAAELPDGRKFAAMSDFKKLLLAEPARTQFVNCLSENLLTYALGRGTTFADEALIKKLSARCAAENYGLRSLVEAVVLCDEFRMK